MVRRRSVLATVPAVALAGCSVPGDPAGGTAGASGGETTSEGSATVTDGGSPASLPAASTYWYTHARPTGNRWLRGDGDVKSVSPVEFEIDGAPQWLVAHPAESGSYWTVVTDDGTATRWQVADGDATRDGRYDPLDPKTQPVVAAGSEPGSGAGTGAGTGTDTDTGDPSLVRPPEDMAARASPIVDPGADDGSRRLLYVAENGDLVVAGESRERFAIDGLPDGRLAAVSDSRYAVLGDTTDRYTHGALGDVIEGTTLVIVDARKPAIVSRTTVGPPEVFEGVQPLVADLDDDGEPEIVTTVADSENGARIVIFSATGDRLATGPIHESGWRHQLAVAPFGPDGRPELAVVRKPHVDHVLEFYAVVDGSLEIRTTASSFRSHTYGSRILDGAVAADLDGDGATEILLPTTDRDTLAAVRHTPDGGEVVWTRSLDGSLRTNVTGVALDDGVAVGAGVGGAVRVWQG